MRKSLFLLLVPILLLSTSAFAGSTPVADIVDNFESYGNTAQLEAAWTIYDGSPTQSLADVAHTGSSSMGLNYNVLRDPFVNWVSYELPQGSDWSEMVKFSIWYQGFESNSADNLSLQMLDSQNKAVFQGNLAGATAHPGWNRWDVNLSGATGDMGTVEAIVVGVEASTTEIPGKGLIYLDDISVSNGIETVWLGKTNDWIDPANWNAGVPTATTDARIPKEPDGGHMPAILSSGAEVHDLTIYSGATLDQNTYMLRISGSLDSRGTTVSTKRLGNNVERTFLTEGGHPGVAIKAGSTAGTGVDLAAGGLGDTSVAIQGGHICPGGGGSIHRCYLVSPSNEISSDITFFFNQIDMKDQVCEDLALYSFFDNAWHEIAGPGDNNIEHQCAMANYSVTVTGITQYDPFLLSDNVPVAITLQSLDATALMPLSPLVIAAVLLALTAFVVLRRSKFGR